VLAANARVAHFRTDCETALYCQIHVHHQNNTAIRSKVDGLEHLQELQTLDLANNTLSAVPRKLQPLQQLQSLNLSGNSILTLRDVALLRPLGSLTTLYLKGNPLACGYEKRYRYLFKLLHFAQVAVDSTTSNTN
jgi:Leucine rich repeat